MGEVEALADGVEDAASHQLLDGFRRLAPGERGRPLQDGELELAAEHRGDAGQLLRARAEPADPGRDHLAHAARQLDAAGVGEAPVAQRAHRLDDDEGIALAEIPRVVHDLGETAGLAARPREGAHERGRGGRRQGAEGDVLDVGQGRQLVDEARERGRLGQILVARRQDEQERAFDQAPGHEGEEPHAHLVGPVQILEDDDHGLDAAQIREHGVEALEEPLMSLLRDESAGRRRRPAPERGGPAPRAVVTARPARASRRARGRRGTRRPTAGTAGSARSPRRARRAGGSRARPPPRSSPRGAGSCRRRPRP